MTELKHALATTDDETLPYAERMARAVSIARSLRGHRTEKRTREMAALRAERERQLAAMRAAMRDYINAHSEAN